MQSHAAGLTSMLSMQRHVVCPSRHIINWKDLFHLCLCNMAQSCLLIFNLPWTEYLRESEFSELNNVIQGLLACYQSPISVILSACVVYWTTLNLCRRASHRVAPPGPRFIQGPTITQASDVFRHIKMVFLNLVSLILNFTSQTKLTHI